MMCYLKNKLLRYSFCFYSGSLQNYTNSCADPFVYQNILVERLVNCGSLRGCSRPIAVFDPLWKQQVVRSLLFSRPDSTCWWLLARTIESWVIPVWVLVWTIPYMPSVNMYTIHLIQSTVPGIYCCTWNGCVFVCVWFRVRVHAFVHMCGLVGISKLAKKLLV